MKILVTGCYGLLGQTVCERAPKSFLVYGVDIHEGNIVLPDDKYFSLDLTDRKKTLELLQDLKPDYIINSAAYTDVDGAETERELCWKINVDLVENLIYGARKIKAGIGHISTDYIFDGKSGPYAEDAHPNPIGYYGRSKLAAENALIGSSVDYFIARTMVLYGMSKNGKTNFVTWLIAQLTNQRPVKIVNDQYGNTTLADELAEGIWTLIKSGYSGILNIAGREIINRYEFAVRIAEVFGFDRDLITAVTTAEFNQPAPRPLNSGLIVDKALNELNIVLSDVVEGLHKFKSIYYSGSLVPG
ncbi:SDR family oxidoreductase [candidate division KSB1 bacterium]|nr:SDR family oxidoreductase [candidate division KSB1 bacterium]